MKSNLILLAILALVGLAMAATIFLERPHATLSPAAEPVLAERSFDGSLIADQKALSTEQDRQAEHCKNGYSEGCDKERAISEFKRAAGQ